MNLMKSLRNMALAAVLLSAGVANAALYQFQLTGDYTATWQIDSNPAPIEFYDGEGFAVWDVEGPFPGSLFGFADVFFYNADIGGGLGIIDYFLGPIVVTDGSQLYTGTEADPTFVLGTFALTEYLGPGQFLLTISEVADVPGEVPEPATAALLLGGLGLLAAARRRRPSA